MSDLETAPNLTPASGGGLKSTRVLRIALAVSVALNLAVAGMFVGAMFHGGEMGGPAGVRELSFGPFTEALSREDRKALRQAFVAKAPDVRNARQQLRVDAQTVLEALRAVPFDPATLTTVMDGQRGRMAARMDAGQAVLRDFLIAMSPEARLAFADRLEQQLRHGGATKPAP